MELTLKHLRRYAIARSLRPETTLPKALERLGFVQADPIRAPARAQDLTLFQRVIDYRAGDLEAAYPKLAVEEDVFVNYGFVTHGLSELMHPREASRAWTKARAAEARAVREFVATRGVVHPREVDAHFDHGRATNAFGGSSRKTTELLGEMHYRGLVRVVRREGGVRCYGLDDRHERPRPSDPEAALDALVDVIVAKYAPLPARTFRQLASALTRLAVPMWRPLYSDALKRAKARLRTAEVEGAEWIWPAFEDPASKKYGVSDRVRLLAPFDPVVWDRLRFELFWGWAYRFEAYTPPKKRKLGYYALPLLFRDEVIGWANLTVEDERLQPSLGMIAGKPPRSAEFRVALDDELGRFARFLGVR